MKIKIVDNVDWKHKCLGICIEKASEYIFFLFWSSCEYHIHFQIVSISFSYS